MPATPPPPPSPPLPFTRAIVPVTPPTSPQRSQHAARHQERSQRVMGSPEQRRTPATPAPAPAPLPLPTYNRQTYHHLPPDLAAQLAALPPLPIRSRHSVAQPFSVSFKYLFKYLG
jgi:hypothetical protein